MLGNLMKYLGYLNNSKFFAGLVMIMLNIGSKYITIELSKSQEQYLKNKIGRQILIFAISWMGSRDILIALALTAIFTVLTDHLFNEEINKATEILEKAKKKEQKREQLRNLNNFMMQV